MYMVDFETFINTTTAVPAAMTIGVFDGVHRGHQVLLEKVVQRGPHPTVVTFVQNPQSVLSPEKYGGDIITLDEKLALFEKIGITRTILIDFSENFSRLQGRVFVEQLIKRGKMAFLVVGSNFRCGYRLDTDAEAIKRQTMVYGVETEIVAPVLYAGEHVSSSGIRAALVAGDFERVKAALGREFIGVS
jgi:riboflavin kinase/FMN adenylyltransferase